ncbi:hypothetical protein Tco_1114995 [Tanacetum coccineum]
MATPIDFSNFAMNKLKIDNLIQEVLLGPVYNLLKGTCQSSIELEYNMEECYKALTDKLDWEKPKVSEKRKYTILITKTKTAKYDLKFIEDMIPNQWSPIKVGYNKDVAFRNAQWGYRHKLWYRSQINKFSLHDVYSTLRILSVLGVESYQKKLNLTKPQEDFPNIFTKEPYTPSFDPPGVVYEDSSKRKRLMRANEFYKFSDGTLTLVRDKLHYRVLNFRMGYNKGMPRIKWSSIDQIRSKIILEMIDELL